MDFNVLNAPYNAPTDGLTDAYPAIQQAANDAMVGGGRLILPAPSAPGGYRLSKPISVTRALTARGDGYESYLANTLQQTGYRGTTLICGQTNGAFNVQSDEPFICEGLMIVHPLRPQGGLVSIQLDAGTTGSLHFNPDSVLRDVFILGADTAVKTINAALWTFDGVRVEGVYTCSFFIQNVNDPGDGDSTIVNCRSSGPPTWHIVIQSSGGLRIANTKMNGGTVGIYGSPNLTSPYQINPLLISGCSIEGTTYGVLLQRNVGNMGIGNVALNGNEIQGSVAAIMAQAAASGIWISQMIITGNVLRTTTGGNCIALSGVNDCGICSNVLCSDGASGVTGLALSGNNNVQTGFNLKGAGVA